MTRIIIDDESFGKPCDRIRIRRMCDAFGVVLEPEGIIDLRGMPRRDIESLEQNLKLFDIKYKKE